MVQARDRGGEQGLLACVSAWGRGVPRSPVSVAACSGPFGALDVGTDPEHAAVSAHGGWPGGSVPLNQVPGRGASSPKHRRRKKGSLTNIFLFVVEKCDSCCHA